MRETSWAVADDESFGIEYNREDACAQIFRMSFGWGAVVSSLTSQPDDICT
jgi:hypothetical protein